MDNNKKEFKPYIPADKVVPEFTVTALLIGILLSPQQIAAPFVNIKNFLLTQLYDYSILKC